VVTLAAMAGLATPAQAGIARGSYHQTNLVSDLPGLAPLQDPQLVNPWGLSSSPTSPIWVSDNNAGVTTLYTGAGKKVNPPPFGEPAVEIPAPGGGPGGTPTGTVFNPTSDFVITSADGTKSGKSLFLFATEDGTVLGWNPGVGGASATIAVDRSTASDSAGDVGAVYKGLTNGSVGSTYYLYASNFRFGTVDVFDGQFHLQSWAGAFTDPSIPIGYAPFGIQNIGGLIYVTYALQNAEKHDDVKGPGHGFVDVYSTSGTLLQRLASGGALNSPWGLASAPAGFGNFHGEILVGNFGDGRITGFTPAGIFRGQLKSEASAPIQIDGLWGLRFGTGVDVSSLFFAAGLDGETHGLFGKINNIEG